MACLSADGYMNVYQQLQWSINISDHLIVLALYQRNVVSKFLANTLSESLLSSLVGNSQTIWFSNWFHFNQKISQSERDRKYAGQPNSGSWAFIANSRSPDAEFCMWIYGIMLELKRFINHWCYVYAQVKTLYRGHSNQWMSKRCKTKQRSTVM